jgi:hypothetical protein
MATLVVKTMSHMHVLGTGHVEAMGAYVETPKP